MNDIARDEETIRKVGLTQMTEALTSYKTFSDDIEDDDHDKTDDDDDSELLIDTFLNHASEDDLRSLAKTGLVMSMFEAKRTETEPVHAVETVWVSIYGGEGHREDVAVV